MIRQEEISAVLDAQADMFRKKEQGLPREALISVPAIPSFATIITGIRPLWQKHSFAPTDVPEI